MSDKKAFIAVFILIIVLAVSVSCRSAAIKPDKDGSYSSTVYSTSSDKGKLTVRYISLRLEDGDTYAGDCAIYTSPEGLVMMIDCGNQVSYRELIPVLDELGISKIDIFVMSHPHIDHIGSFCEIADHCEIGKVYRNYLEYSSATFARSMKKIEEKGIAMEILHEGDSFMFGNDVSVEVFWPYTGQTVNMDNASDTNHSSIAMKITYGESTFWTAGDLYTADEVVLAERYGDRMQCDVMKMNHHGKDTSSSKAFISAVKPLVAVSTQSQFSSITVTNTFRASGATVFHTCFDGTVMVSTTGDGHYEVQTQYIREQKKLYGLPSEDGHYSI